MKKILVITSYHTGSGHKSISDSIIGCLHKSGAAEVREVDGFTLIGRAGQKLAGEYGLVASDFPRLWEELFGFSDRHSDYMDKRIAFFGRKRFQALLDDFNPELIITVHSMFNHSVSLMLQDIGRRIPLITVQADIVSLHTSWCNPDADLTVCLTEEAYRVSLQKGMPKEKLVVSGFPVRSQFTEAADCEPEQPYDGTGPLKCLMLLGSEGSSKMTGYVQNLMEGTDFQLTVICGHNTQMKKRLAELQGVWPGRLNVLGYVQEMAKVMRLHDLLISRSSPNVLFEGITMLLPIVAICTLQGQEKDNDLLIASNNLGVRASDYPDLKTAVYALAGREKYQAVREAQRVYRSLDSAQRIADIALDFTGEILPAKE